MVKMYNMGLFSFFKKKQKDNNKIHPESKWIVNINDSVIRTIDYKGIETKIRINDISQIIIKTNDTGPWGTDVWWIILGKEVFLSVPNGATGESKMVDIFQKLPNFNNEELIKAMRSTDNTEFICWEKKL